MAHIDTTGQDGEPSAEPPSAEPDAPPSVEVIEVIDDGDDDDDDDDNEADDEADADEEEPPELRPKESCKLRRTRRAPKAVERFVAGPIKQKASPSTDSDGPRRTGRAPKAIERFKAEPSKPTEDAVVDADAMVDEAEGFRLHTSAYSSTGYLGVYVLRNGRFKAVRGAKHLGTFVTAVEAAVAFAKAAAESDEQDQDDESEEEEIVEQAEGLQLHLSSKSATGYKGVRRQNNSYYAHSTGSEKTYLGSFGTAVEAAVAYARHVQEEGTSQREDATDAKRPRLGLGDAAPSSTPTAASSFVQKLAFVKQHLGIDEAEILHLAIARANELMGLEPEGSLPEQVDRLVAMLSV